MGLFSMYQEVIGAQIEPGWDEVCKGAPRGKQQDREDVQRGVTDRSGD